MLFFASVSLLQPNAHCLCWDNYEGTPDRDTRSDVTYGLWIFVSTAKDKPKPSTRRGTGISRGSQRFQFIPRHIWKLPGAKANPGQGFISKFLPIVCPPGYRSVAWVRLKHCF